MILDEPMDWPRLAGADSEAMRFVADPGGFPPVAWPAVRRGRDVILAVGPEGGFTADEVELAIRAGWSAIQLGRNILRVETAGLAGCAALLSRVLEIVD
jgi:16S rRNA (uracil1498-N3)-methyltransferase